MIGYITLGSNNIAESAQFYDELFKLLGAKRTYDYETFVGWGNDPTASMFSIISPFDGKPASVGNGVMIAITVPSPAVVDEIHAKALSLGAVNEGNPGVRQETYYCAYFRDMDGHKLNFFCAV